MSTATNPARSTRRATIDNLLNVEGKVELIDGRVVHFMATGHQPNRVAFRIPRSLDDYAEAPGRGVVLTGSMGFAVPELPSGRESFSPDASYYVGPIPDNPMRFVTGAPTFAVEVRSETDYGPAAETKRAAKRADYFEAGTSAVWDVGPLARAIRKFRPESPPDPTSFGPGMEADAEPAVPGWRIPVNRLFV